MDMLTTSKYAQENYINLQKFELQKISHDISSAKAYKLDPWTMGLISNYELKFQKPSGELEKTPEIP